MQDFKPVIPLAVSIFILVIYVTVLLVRFEDMLTAPPTQRVMRDISVVRLPRLFFCPADRYRQAGVIWNSYECSLSYKMEVGQCGARVQHFGGEEPQDFRHGANWSDSCLEFATHRIGVKQEWSAAWNEITLKAAFLQPAHLDTQLDVIQEMELGYLPKEWEVGAEPSTIEHLYSPLLRVPIYQPASYSEPTRGVATRLFLAEVEDHGRHAAGDFWYTYGATTVPVENATVPEIDFGFPHEHGEWVKAAGSRRGVAHIVITLEDFTKYEYRVQPVIYPLLSLFSQVSGVVALFCWAFFKSPMAAKRLLHGSQKTGDVEANAPAPSRARQPAVTHHAGAQYRSIGEEAEEEEQQSLLEVEGRGADGMALLQAGGEGEGL
mmetsp:Transcript_37562/g.70029  ORF Transcript_37562/g.70029 Transcript_37562/m.70029 type:complete len:378 (+) Transcript_37562:73-1206(+)